MKHTTQKEKSETYTLEDVGCYVDSVRGIYAVDAIIQFAESHGFDVNDNDPQNPLPESLSDYEFSNEIEDEADDYMNEKYGVDGAYWGRNENSDWGLWTSFDGMTDTQQSKPEISGTIAREFIQCADETGKIGSFLATAAKRRVSPTFGRLSDLYTWARNNGWKSECGAYIYKKG